MSIYFLFISDDELVSTVPSDIKAANKSSFFYFQANVMQSIVLAQLLRKWTTIEYYLRDGSKEQHPSAMKSLQTSREIYNNQICKVASNWNYHFKNMFNGTTLLHIQVIRYQTNILCVI